MPLEDQLLAAVGEEDVTPSIPETEPEITSEPTLEVAPETTEELPETEPTETPAQTELRLAQYIKEQFGEDFTGKYQSDHELLKGFVHAAKKIGERDDDAQIGRFLRENPQGAFQWLQQQMGMTPAQAAQTVQNANAPNTNGIPEFDPEWDRVVELDEHGRAIGVKPGNDPSIATKFNAAMKYARERQRELLFNPEKALQPLLTQAEERAVQKARTQWEQEFSTRYGQMAEMQEAQGVLNTHKAWMFVGGDPGSKQLTAAGRVYKETVDAWHQRRPEMTSAELNEIAMHAVYAKFPPQRKTTAAKPGAPTKTINVQKPTQGQDTQRREGETAYDFLTRVNEIYKMIPDE